MGNTRWVLGLGLAWFCGCGGSEGDDADVVIDCDPSERTGTYLMTADEISGDCGPMPESLGRLKDSMPDPPNESCTVTAETWSEGNCKLERALTCNDNGLVYTGVGVSQQVTDDGSRLEGTLTFRVTEPEPCASTYRIRFERQ